MDDWILFMGIGIIFLISIIFLAVFNFVMAGKKSTPKKQVKQTKKIETPQIINNDIGPALWLHNHLKKDLTAIYYSPDGKTNTILYPLIPAETVIGIPMQDVHHLQVSKGGKIQFKLKESIDNNEVQDIYGDYLLKDINLPKHIYIGLIITKTLHFTSPVIFGGVYEMTFINIHNRLSVPLTFNGHIHVPANNRVIYNGYNLDGGVAVGEVFNNDEGFFNPFEIEIPVSDVYFGVVSDQDLPVYQGNKYLWQGKL